MFAKTYGTMYYVDDMNKAVAWYKGTLGLKPGYESSEWTEFTVGEHNICLHNKRPGETYRENGVLILSFEGVKDLFAKMKNEGLDVFGLHEVHPGHWTFHINDEHRNELSIFGPG
jgi:catechol 2,3-dioxygenase-like lactoylglutathione lyase family enzyme